MLIKDFENSIGQGDATWNSVLQQEFEKPYFQVLELFMQKERRDFVIYPPEDEVFNAFSFTDWSNVKVVIIGQDPYHGEGQAHGLSFSVRDGVRKPPSLQNIFKELNSDIGMCIPTHGNLETWAKQGVLLLNACLTVRKQSPASHQNKGWEFFTNAVIQKISAEKKNVVFMLWGNFAHQKSSLINARKHLILKAVHPSPMSVHRGFFGCKHFSDANRYLIENNIAPINWNTVNE
jgi:uracil-DNA glycosylase